MKIVYIGDLADGSVQDQTNQRSYKFTNGVPFMVPDSFGAHLVDYHKREGQPEGVAQTYRPATPEDDKQPA